MSDAYSEAAPAGPQAEPSPQASRRKKQGLDTGLTLAIIFLVLAILGLATYFGYAVYQDRKVSELTNAPARVVASLEKQVRRSPNDIVLRVRLGEGYAAAGKYRQAVAQFNEALKVDPKHVGAYLDLGLVSELVDEPKKAEAYFLKVVELTDKGSYTGIDERREKAIFHLGLLKLDQKRYPEAAGYFKEALRIRKDASDTYLNLALALKGMKETDAAIQNLEIALTFDPGYAEAHYELGQIYREQKDDVNASYHLYKAAKAAPNVESAQEALAELGQPSDWAAKADAALKEGELETAVDEILVARNLDPENAAFIRQHAGILLARDNFKGAAEVLLEALKLDPKDAEAKSSLKSLEQQHRKTVLAVYKAAQKKDPSNEYLKERLKALQ